MSDDHGGKADHVPTAGEAEISGTLETVANSGEGQCRFCDYVAEGDSFGEIFEDLAEHGEQEHDWDPTEGWSE
ncbi:hypothetical protein [Halorubrum aethiopicum]|uniref:hypothetical protein n=1 Tax=Halorubrum aethiopicum TaxID=1758255 RepID=UPI000AD849BE|nr:hypothetical protein [Halorubrum aethiopicum]